MKILHLADLHIGKKVNDFCMIEEQKNALSQALDLVREKNIEAVLICGDVFDRAVAPISALEVFNNFLNELNMLEVKILIISGNHDNMDRMAYMSTLLEKSNVFISKSYEGNIQQVSLNDEINVYLMPYLFPALVRKYNPNCEINSYNDAIKAVVDNIEIEENKFNIIMAHQFVVGSEEVVLSQSEQKSVGGIDEVKYNVFKKFDYTALGHLHCPQKCGAENVRYAGSILKYSFSEINQKKSFCVLDIKNKELNISYYPIKFLHEMKEYKGFLNDFLNKDFYEKIAVDDYIHFILQDEQAFDSKKKLSLIYPNIMLLEFDNSYTRGLNVLKNSAAAKDKTMYEHFLDFYQMQMNSELDPDKDKIVKEVINLIGGV